MEAGFSVNFCRVARENKPSGGWDLLPARGEGGVEL